MDKEMNTTNSEKEQEKEPFGFVGFVLLEDAVWNKNSFSKALADEWQIQAEEDDTDDTEKDLEAAVFYYQDALISVALMPGPVPEEEVVYHAGSNYMWKDAVETSKKHQAHLVVAVLKGEMPILEAGELFVKVAATCCKLPNALGIYVNETVYESQMYAAFAEMIKEDYFPIFNLVWFGLYRGEKGMCGYTAGLKNFGYDEIEVIDSSASPQEIREFLTNIALYVTQENIVLEDGETIGFSADEKLPITKSEGVAVEGDSLKIGFPA